MKNEKTARRTVRAAQVAETLCAAKRVLITGHVRPDGDSLGGMIALAHLLNGAGIRAVAAAARTGLGGPGFLTGVEKLLAPEEAAGRSFDLMVSLDCGAFDRLPEALQPLASRLPLINIDHHLTNTFFGTLNWIDGRASSTGEMLWRLARKAGWRLDTVSAEALWVALITDTG
ncbi:MAG: DHH family phosphoesterase, partial [Kiritimatiellia bacterium]|nr:DHH family phosphoesterase [Kiritimatiellia bacterium]